MFSPNTAADARSEVGALLMRSASLGRVLSTASEVEWQAAPYLRPADDAPDADARRAKGGPASDPTHSLVSNEPRWRLRAATAEALDALQHATAVVTYAEQQVLVALRPYGAAA